MWSVVVQLGSCSPAASIISCNIVLQVLVMPFLKKRIDRAFETIDKWVPLVK